jgi:regulator of replication initiation timing
MFILQATLDNPILSAFDIEKLGIVGILFLGMFGMYKYLTKQIKELKDSNAVTVGELKEENKQLREENRKLNEALVELKSDINGQFATLIKDNTEAMRSNTQFFMNGWIQKSKQD